MEMNCKDTQEKLLDLLEGNLEEITKNAVEVHISSCDSCREELRVFRTIITDLEAESDAIQVPDDFMLNVRKAVSKTRKKKLPKRWTTIGLVATLFLTLFVGTAVATNGFVNFIDWWKDFGKQQSEQMENYVEHGLGDYLNLQAESNDVKVTITSVVADDIQTLIYYEVESQKQDEQYMINYTDGLQITNQDENWVPEDHPDYSPVNNHLNIHSEDSRIYKGRIGVAPISTEEGTIQLELSKLEKVASSDKQIKEFTEGDWRFEIPIKKHPAIIHEFQVETEINGNPVMFEKLTIAPTVTVLSYRYRNENPYRKMDYMTIASLESKGKHVYNQLGLAGYGGSGGWSDGWSSEETTFESLYFEEPTDIGIHIGSASFSIHEPVEFAIDSEEELPQIIEYLGNKISIENLDVGKQTTIEMTEELSPERSYETLKYDIYDKDGEGSLNIRSDGYFIDKNGGKYKANDFIFRLHELSKPKFFSTHHHITAYRDDGQEFVPTTLAIEGYTVTTFYDEKIVISLE